MSIFIKRGEKLEPGKTIIRFRSRRVNRWADDGERVEFIRGAHFLFHTMGEPLRVIADTYYATLEDVRNALKCDVPKEEIE